MKLLALLLSFLPAVGMAQGLNGKFTYAGDDCAVRPVYISAIALDMGHVECRFLDAVAVSDMQAELRRADCSVEGVPEKTRFFIVREAQGVFLYSPEFGSERLQDCP